jgi:hypothetical protein
MPAALVSHAIANGVNGATTSGIDTTGATLLVLGVSDFTGGPGVTISDSKGNTWTALTAFSNSAGAMRVRIYYAWNPSVGTGHTFTSAGTGVYTAIAASAFSGIETGSDPYQGDVTGISDFGPDSIPMSAGSLAVAASDLAITVEGTPFGASTTVWTIDAGYTITDQYHQSGVTEGVGLAYYIDSGSGATKNPGWDPDIVVSAAATHATFQAAAGGDVTPPTLGSLAVNTTGDELTGTLSESGCTPSSGTGGFTLSGTAATVASWAISGTTLTLTLAGTVYNGETVTLSYDDATASEAVADAADNLLADISAASVTNNSTVDAPAPSGGSMFRSAVISRGRML